MDGPTWLAAARVLEIAPLFAAYAAGSGACGTCHVNLGDAGLVAGLAFCHPPAMDVRLMPDPFFVSTRGYAAHRAAIDTAPPWEERHQAAIWRGSSTGLRTGPVLGLPRVKLCQLSHAIDGLDAGLTHLAQLDPAEQAAIRAANLMRSPIPAERFANWKYQIDIDGNTNSWSGLFQKLLTGSPVLKVASPHGYRQWYYDRLIPWRNIVPVAPDLTDLAQALARLRADDPLARRIGEAGRALALSLTPPAEFTAAIDPIETAIALQTAP